MRVYLLLILFFVSNVSARAQIRSNVEKIAIDPLTDPTNEVNHEKIIAKRSIGIQGLAGVISIVDTCIKFITAIFKPFVSRLNNFAQNIIRIINDLFQDASSPLRYIKDDISKFIKQLIENFKPKSEVTPVPW